MHQRLLAGNRTAGRRRQHGSPVVPDEVLEAHAPVIRYLAVVQVGVEHDGAEGHGESGVGVDERMPARPQPLFVLLPSERFHQAVDALRLEKQTSQVRGVSLLTETCMDEMPALAVIPRVYSQTSSVTEGIPCQTALPDGVSATTTADELHVSLWSHSRVPATSSDTRRKAQAE